MKFILTEHIYESGAFNGADVEENHGFEENWYEDSSLRSYYRLLNRHKDKIAFKITGHDHLTDFRVHSSTELFSEESLCNEQYNQTSTEPFLGKLVSPSFTAQQWQNPGYATFDWSTDDQKLINPGFTFFNLNETIGQPDTFTDFTWYSVDLSSSFGLTEMTS